MQRTTLTLPDELLIALKREARRRDTSVSEIAREALIQHFGLDATGPRKLPFVGIGRSGYRDTSERIDEILDDAWGRARDR
ncbi:MAG TPA: CopG family transcriptional regulator [Chloroflexota bacterium]|nr:CopG family transcriptional regulator [Chloroflexota bacterium]